MKKYTRYSRELLKLVAENNFTFAGCLRELGLKPTGGNYSNLQRNFDRFGIDTSHFKGQAHNAGKELKPFGELVCKNTIKTRLIKQRGHVCESCFLKVWLKEDIPLEMDHIDGNNRNNHKDNLRLLCPNCHALTPTYRNRRREY